MRKLNQTTIVNALAKCLKNPHNWYVPALADGEQIFVTNSYIAIRFYAPTGMDANELTQAINFAAKQNRSERPITLEGIRGIFADTMHQTDAPTVSSLNMDYLSRILAAFKALGCTHTSLETHEGTANVLKGYTPAIGVIAEAIIMPVRR